MFNNNYFLLWKLYAHEKTNEAHTHTHTHTTLNQGSYTQKFWICKLVFMAPIFILVVYL